MSRVRISMLMLALLVTAGCYKEPVAITTYPPTESPLSTNQPSSSPAPSPTATPVPTLAPTATPSDSPSASPLAGTPSAGCVNGWSSPSPGSAEYEQAMALLDAGMGVGGPWRVDEMRYFTGPDVLVDYPVVVRYWYMRGSLVDDPQFRGRWLLVYRTETINGIAAVAPYESFGYQPPDWTGFVGDGPPTNYLGLPGQWSGTPYDFVTGGGNTGQPGLHEQVVDCLSAT